MSSLLEVIVTSIEEALEAQAGGADRLELLSAPEHAGLTPSLDVVRSIVEAVSIPVRVMLRDRPSMCCRDATEMTKLQQSAAQFSRLRIDGIVTGFIRDDQVDEHALREISAAAPQTSLTFHRAFDVLPDQRRALAVLRNFSQVDRILTAAGPGEWHSRLLAFSQLQQAAAPNIKIILAAGKDAGRIAELRNLPLAPEVHVGRAARDPQTYSGCVSRVRVSALKLALDGPGS